MVLPVQEGQAPQDMAKAPAAAEVVQAARASVEER